MSQKFLIAVDGSDHSWKAVDIASNVAKACGAELLVLHVASEDQSTEGLEKLALEGIAIKESASRAQFLSALSDQMTEGAEKRVQRNGVDRLTIRIVEGHPAHEIVKTAKSENVDMIFLGSRGRSDMMGLVMGSVSHKVMHLAPCTCVVVR